LLLFLQELQNDRHELDNYSFLRTPKTPQETVSTRDDGDGEDSDDHITQELAHKSLIFDRFKDSWLFIRDVLLYKTMFFGERMIAGAPARTL